MSGVPYALIIRDRAALCRKPSRHRTHLMPVCRRLHPAAALPASRFSRGAGATATHLRPAGTTLPLRGCGGGTAMYPHLIPSSLLNTNYPVIRRDDAAAAWLWRWNSYIPIFDTELLAEHELPRHPQGRRCRCVAVAVERRAGGAAAGEGPAGAVSARRQRRVSTAPNWQYGSVVGGGIPQRTCRGREHGG